VSYLETKVETLTREVQNLQTLTHYGTSPVTRGPVTALPTLTTSPASTGRTVNSDGSPRNIQDDVIKSVQNIAIEPSRQPRFLGQSGGITLARLVIAAVNVDTLHAPQVSEQNKYDNDPIIPASEASLPPRNVADHLVHVYFQFRSPHLPIISRIQVEEAVESAYLHMNNCSASDRVVEKDIFTTFMILAIALCDVPNPSGGRSSQREGCFRSAVCLIEKVITYSKSDLETIRVVLLLSQFIARCPSWGSLWHLTGTALRLCIDTGIHWETEEQILSMDPKLLHERRRLWHSTYQFDRLLSITLGRPLGIIDESIRVELPDPLMTSYSNLGREPDRFDLHNQQSHNHLFTMSKLESEIRHVQHSQSWTPRVACPKPDYAAWIKDIQPRLQEWYDTIPTPSKAHPDSIFACQAYWDSIYYSSVLLLYRPNSVVSHPSTEELRIAFEASCQLIANIKFLQREGKIDIYWKTVHSLFIAGLGVVYGLWYSKELRGRYPLKHSISALQACASTLSALSEIFQGAVGCRDIFDALSSATVDWLLTNDAEIVRQSRVHFEHQVKDLLQQLHPTSDSITAANENSAQVLSTMLSTNTFALSEMLSSAAQWPELQDLDMSGESTTAIDVEFPMF
jgi:hypothetical protein